jgi:DNA repair exonuclease SbcCD nuclease subunit
VSNIRLLTSSDEHLADLNPGYRKDCYRDAVLEKLEWQGQLASKLEADAVVRVGDFFHVKPANKTTMATVAQSARIHRNYSCPTYAIGGNHDMSYNDPLSIPKQPLGVLLRSGVFRHLKDETLTSGTLNVRLIGVEYTTDLYDDALREAVKKNDSSTYTIAFVHALAAFAPEERIQSFFNERVFDYRDLVFEGCPDVYVFGHYHKDQGVKEHLGVKFVNLGAVSRGALTFENLDRIPKVSSIICNSQGISIDVHDIPIKDASEVFDLEKKKVLDKERRNLDEFIKILRTTSTSTFESVDGKLEELKNSGYSEDLRNLILDTIEAAEGGVLED